MATFLLVALLALTVLYFLVETAAHNRRWRTIPIRIHVNGTRGKSSTARLIAAGLRASGRTVMAKTTGTTARVILPNGRELPIFRPLGANIREQFRVVRLASRLRADVLVIECMALQPELQWLSERWFVHATHGVITNCRPDHLDVMGPDSASVAQALAGMVPRKGTLFTAEVAQRETIEVACKDRNTKLVAIDDDDVTAISHRDLAGFRHREHPQNIALALKVCESLGTSREEALSAMWRAQPDSGAMFVLQLEFFGRTLLFVNGFAANDPESSEEAWRYSVERYGKTRKRLALINCRADRSDRSRQLAEIVAKWDDVDHVVVMGSGTAVFSRTAAKAGLDPTRMVLLEGEGARDIFEALISLTDEEDVLVVGLCNIGGAGLELLQLIKNRSRTVPTLEEQPQ